MFLVYEIVLPLLALILSPVILVAFIIKPKLRAGFFSKIGLYSNPFTERKTVVFHAVSVGEVNAISQLIKEYRVKNPNKFIVLTTTTKTGQEVAQNALASVVDEFTYFPYDFLFSVESFFDTYTPETVVIAETEIWPCFVNVAKKRGIKVYIANGRISPHSYDGYRKFSLFFKPILAKYEKIMMQSKGDAARIVDIGADPDKTFIMGNLKFDIMPALTVAEVSELKEGLKLGENRLLIAASTHDGEEEIVLTTYKKLKEKHTDLKLMIAPRHPQRYQKVEELIRYANMSYGRRSNGDNFEENEIIMLDTMGELANIFSVCSLAYIGGSFSQTGGHNPLEANIWGKPVVSGPNVFNFTDIYKFLTSSSAATVVSTEDDLEFEIDELLSDQEYYSQAQQDALTIFEESRGAVEFVLNEI